MSRRNNARKGRTVPRKGTPDHQLRGTFSIEKIQRDLFQDRMRREDGL
ncbi:hypothetical protein [Lentzea sp. NBRC 102530]|nr:hypothetical protein [Lentzea sp. NBRC 102530]GLY55343.1 hypothetical protein Lesp01_89980 [Lentzea sp. NBRC 102530]